MGKTTFNKTHYHMETDRCYAVSTIRRQKFNRISPEKNKITILHKTVVIEPEFPNYITWKWLFLFLFFVEKLAFSILINFLHFNVWAKRTLSNVLHTHTDTGVWPNEKGKIFPFRRAGGCADCWWMMNVVPNESLSFSFFLITSPAKRWWLVCYKKGQPAASS